MPVDITEQLKDLLDKYGDIPNKAELLRMEKYKLIQSLLPDQLKITLDEIEFEFEDKEKQLEFEEKNLRKNLDSVIEEYAHSLALQKGERQTISSKFASVTFADDDVEWDTAGLDALIVEKGMTELLQYRHPKGIKTRVTKKKL